MTDNQLTESTPAELKEIFEIAKGTRMTAAINNQWSKFQKMGELMLKCQQLLEFKCR